MRDRYEDFSREFELGEALYSLLLLALAVILVFVLAFAWSCDGAPGPPRPAHAAPRLTIGDPAIPDVAPDLRPTVPAMRLALPVVLGHGAPFATKTPTTPLRPSQTPLRPSTADEILAALKVAGADVEPVEGSYKLGGYGWMASGTKLDGKGRVTLKRRGLIVDGQRDVTIKNISIDGSPIDGITVQRSTGILIEGVQVRGFLDGGWDFTHSPPGGMVIVVKDSTVIGHKCSLVGNQTDPADSQILVSYRNVNWDCYGRTPKVHRGVVQVHGGVVRYSRTAIDCQMGAKLRVFGTHFISGQTAIWRVSVAQNGTCDYEEQGVTTEGLP